MAVGFPTTWRGLSQQKARWFYRDGEVRRSRHSFGLPEPGLESQGCQSSRRWVYGTQLPAATGGPPPSPFLSLPKSPPAFYSFQAPKTYSLILHHLLSACPVLPQLCLVRSSSLLSRLQPSLALFSPLQLHLHLPLFCWIPP